jgi:hypothetical protein
VIRQRGPQPFPSHAVFFLDQLRGGLKSQPSLIRVFRFHWGEMDSWTLKGVEMENRMGLHSAPSGVGGWERNANEQVRGVQINVFICGSDGECNRESSQDISRNVPPH